jgi:transcription-repair coupling factor (superfamily II helicase)
LFAEAGQSPGVRLVANAVEKGGVLSCPGVPPPAQSFLAALLHARFPSRPILILTDGLKTQETFEQVLGTWLRFSSETSHDARSPESPRPLFFPAWEILPADGKLPHADVISDRLETLVKLREFTSTNTSGTAPIVVANVEAVLQGTFAPDAIAARTRKISIGDRIDPLDLVEWLEAEGYEPEAQVTQKSELALRGGILDVYPLTSPWPIRIEFSGTKSNRCGFRSTDAGFA